MNSAARRLPPKAVRAAILSGPIPKIRDVDHLDPRELTRGERIVRFAHDYLVVPEGKHVGKPLRLDVFQIAFILAVFDNKKLTTMAIMSMARRNGKTFLMAVILLAFILGPEAVVNSTLASAAQSRDQAALVFKIMVKTLRLSPRLKGLFHIIPTQKSIIGLRRNVEFFALSSETATGFGKSLLVVLLDESGQIRGPHSDYVDMLVTSQGSYDNPLFITISTQAPSDADLLSTWIDAAATSGDITVVCHVYAAANDCEVDDLAAWKASNPGLDNFRSRADMVKRASEVKRLPSAEAGFRNLNLNQRIASERLWLAPTVWKLGKAAPALELFDTLPIAIGLDLSQRQDLTAAIAAVMDDNGHIHLQTMVFAPAEGMTERARRDRAPYDEWVKRGFMVAVPGSTVSYEWVCQYLALRFQGRDIRLVAFDRWRIKEFMHAAENFGFQPAGWKEVGQGYKDFSPRVEYFEEILLAGRLHHGLHPLLNMGAANAMAVTDPAGNRKLDKAKATQRIDPLVAAVMAVFAVNELHSVVMFDAEAYIG